MIIYIYFSTSLWSDVLDPEFVKDKFLETHRDTSLGKFYIY